MFGSTLDVGALERVVLLFGRDVREGRAPGATRGLVKVIHADVLT